MFQTASERWSRRDEIRTDRNLTSDALVLWLSVTDPDFNYINEPRNVATTQIRHHSLFTSLRQSMGITNGTITGTNPFVV